MSFEQNNTKIVTAQKASSQNFDFTDEQKGQAQQALSKDIQTSQQKKSEDGVFTLNDIIEILNWLLRRAQKQYQQTKQPIKEQYYDNVRSLISEVKKLQETKKLKGSDIVSLDDIDSIYTELGFGREYGKRNIKSRRPPKDGEQSYEAGGEESGRERSPLLNKPFSGSNYLQIENLLIAYNLQDEFPSLMRGTPSILMDFFYNRRSKAITDGRPDTVTEKNYLIYLQHAIDKIQKRYIEFENAKQREPNNSDIRIAEHLKRLIGEMARQL